MKTTYSILAIMASVMIVASCSRHIEKAEPLQGDGNVISRTIELDPFYNIVMELPVELHYIQSEKYYVKITADSNIIEAMNPRVHRKTLQLTYFWPEKAYFGADKKTMLPTHGIIVEVGAPKLSQCGWNLTDECPDLHIQQALLSHEKSYLFSQMVNFDDNGLMLSIVQHIPSRPTTFDIFYGTLPQLDSIKKRYEGMLDIWDHKEDRFARANNIFIVEGDTSYYDPLFFEDNDTDIFDDDDFDLDD